MEVSAEREYDILNRLGLHARAAAKLVGLANSFACEIRLAKDGMEVNGKSIMGVLMLAAPKDTKILTSGRSGSMRKRPWRQSRS